MSMTHRSPHHHLLRHEKKRNSSEFNQFNRPNKPKIFRYFLSPFHISSPERSSSLLSCWASRSGQTVESWRKKKRFFFDVLTRLIALLHSGQQQFHAFCKLEWAKSAIFCTRMTNFTEVLSFKFVTLLLWLAVFARLGHMSSWIRSWVGRICHVESAAGVCKFYPENFSCWISPKHANYRSETDSRKKLLMDSTRLIKFLRNFRETCVSRWIILILEHRIVIVS